MLNDVVEERTGDSKDLDELKLKVFLSSLLSAGSKSVSHITALTDRYMSVFQHFLTKSSAAVKDSHSNYQDLEDQIQKANDDVRLQIMNTVAEFWQDNEQMIVIITDKYLSLKLLDCHSIISWAFSDDNVPKLTK